jgi:hypothetical protein
MGVQIIEVDFPFIRERVASRNLQIRFLPMKDQLADRLTKPLAQGMFRSFRYNLNLAPTTPRLRGLLDKMIMIDNCDSL